MNSSRRRFLFAGAATLVAAPTIIRVAANLMSAGSVRLKRVWHFNVLAACGAEGDRYAHTISGTFEDYDQAVAAFAQKQGRLL